MPWHMNGRTCAVLLLQLLKLRTCAARCSLTAACSVLDHAAARHRAIHGLQQSGPSTKWHDVHRQHSR